MENRIYSKAQREAGWKQKGLLRLPKSNEQARLAFAAREFVEGLNCYSEVRQMLALGKRPRDVAILIQKEQKEPPFLSFNTLKKYGQVYRNFFISPLETLKANVDNRTEGVPSIVDRKLNGLLGKIQEIEALEQKVKTQAVRIEAQVKKEEELSGLALPGIRLELLAYKELLHELVKMKMDLGYPGYQRVPQKVDIREQLRLTKIQQLSSEDKCQLVDFGRTIFGLIEMARTKGNSESPPEQLLPQ